MGNGAIILREFLVSIGFKIDAQQAKSFEVFWNKTTQAFKTFGIEALGAATELSSAVVEIAGKFDKLFYVSQRTGASVDSLQALQYGAEQIGLSAEDATASIEGMAHAMRSSPGTKGLLKSLGIDPNQKDTANTFMQLMDVLRRMPYFQGAQYAQMFGIDDKAFFQYSKNYDKLKKSMDDRKKLAASAGVSGDELARESMEFTNNLKAFEEKFKVLESLFLKEFLPVGETVLGWMKRALDYVIQLDGQTGGWSTKILAVVSALGALKAAQMALSGVKGLLGLGGKAASAEESAALASEGAVAAEGAGVGAAEAAGGGLLGIGALPLVVAAACAAAIGWMVVHPDAAKKAVKNTWNAAKKEWKVAPAQAKGLSMRAHKALSGFADKWKKDNPEALAELNKVKDGVGAFVAKHEGFMAQLYKDDAGFDTVGFGHKVLRGEDYSKGVTPKQGIKLLESDLTKAMLVVKASVKVPISQNQMKALSDFEFNVGRTAFENSTLLKKFNKGDNEGAAQEFMRWNKVHVKGAVLIDRGLTNRRREEAEALRTERAVSIDQTTNVHVHGVQDPGAAGRAAAAEQRNVNGQLIRNLKGAVR